MPVSLDRLETRVPPPLVALGVAGLMWLVSRLVPPVDVPQLWSASVSLVLVLVGLGCMLAGAYALVRARTTINPITPEATSSLVATGIYRLTRNPMYFGLLLILMGWAAFLASAAAVVLTPIFVAYINRFQIIPEERALSAKFGAAFVAYQRDVRRWL